MEFQDIGKKPGRSFGCFWLFLAAFTTAVVGCF